jgi:hypothetical protein
MYRCAECDTPAQFRCVCATVTDFDKAMEKMPDPWGFKEDPVKLDIQAGVRVPDAVYREREGVCS